MKYLKYGLIVSLSLCMTFSSAFADHRDGPEGPGGQFFEQLDLSPQQREQLRGLRGQREQMHDLGAQVRKQRRELGEMLRSDAMSDAHVLESVDTLNKTLSDLNVARVKNMLEMKRILTPEQRQKAREMLRKKWQERRESGGEEKGDWFWKRKGGGGSCGDMDSPLADDSSGH